MPPFLNFSRKACCVFLMEGKPLMSANKAQPAYIKSLAQFAKKSQVAKKVFFYCPFFILLLQYILTLEIRDAFVSCVRAAS